MPGHAHRNHRHPMALQAEVKKRLLAEGKIDEHGNKLVKGAPKVPPPPPPSRPKNVNMVTSGSTEVRAPLTATPNLIVLSPREKLEALPDAEILAKAETLNLNKEGASRDTLINALLEAGAEG